MKKSGLLYFLFTLLKSARTKNYVALADNNNVSEPGLFIREFISTETKRINFRYLLLTAAAMAFVSPLIEDLAGKAVFRPKLSGALFLFGFLASAFEGFTLFFLRTGKIADKAMIFAIAIKLLILVIAALAVINLIQYIVKELMGRWVF